MNSNPTSVTLKYEIAYDTGYNQGYAYSNQAKFF